MIRAILFTLAVVAVLLAAGRQSNHAAPRSPEHVIPAAGTGASDGPRSSPASGNLAPASEAPSSGMARAATASPSVLAAVSLPSPATQTEPPAVFGGGATWYCSRTSACTRGYGPSDYIAAVDRSTGIRRGDRVRVWYRGHSVVVRVVDVCACAGVRVIDLSRVAFSRLADPGLGVIPVAVELLR